MIMIMWHESRVGMIHDDGALAYGNPVVQEMYDSWEAAQGIVHMGPGETTDDGQIAEGAFVLPITLENVSRELRATGFTLVDIQDAPASV
jgi:hypothetical protein